jgi:hypothetical protein
LKVRWSQKLNLTLKKYFALEKTIAISSGNMALCSFDDLQKFTKNNELPPNYGPVYSIEPSRQDEYEYLRKTTF